MVGLIVDSSLVFALPVSLILFWGGRITPAGPAEPEDQRGLPGAWRCRIGTNHRTAGADWLLMGGTCVAFSLKALSRLIGLRLKTRPPGVEEGC